MKLKKVLKWVGSVVVAVLVVEWLLAVNFVKLADSTALIVLSVVVVCFVLMALFAGLVIWLVLRDRADERRGQLLQQSLIYPVNPQAAALLKEYVARGLRVIEVGGQEVLCYPDGRMLPAASTDLTASELDLIKHEQAQ